MALYIGFPGVKQQFLEACLYNWIRPDFRRLEIHGVYSGDFGPGITILGASTKTELFFGCCI